MAADISAASMLNCRLPASTPQNMHTASITIIAPLLYVHIKVNYKMRPNLGPICQAAHHMLARYNSGWRLIMF
jgi:hypothetical protein